MKTSVINFKTDSKTKKEAQKIAKEMGLPLSAIMNAQLRELVRTKTVTISTESYTPTPYLEKILEESEKEQKAGYVSPAFDTVKDMTAWLNDPEAKYANGTRAHD